MNIEQRSLIDITYVRPFGAGEKFVYSCVSKTKEDALDKFWEGKNKEMFEVVRIEIKETFQVLLNSDNKLSYDKLEALYERRKADAEFWEKEYELLCKDLRERGVLL